MPPWTWLKNWIKPKPRFGCGPKTKDGQLPVIVKDTWSIICLFPSGWTKPKRSFAMFWLLQWWNWSRWGIGPLPWTDPLVLHWRQGHKPETGLAFLVQLFFSSFFFIIKLQDYEIRITELKYIIFLFKKNHYRLEKNRHNIEILLFKYIILIFFPNLTKGKSTHSNGYFLMKTKARPLFHKQTKRYWNIFCIWQTAMFQVQQFLR